MEAPSSRLGVANEQTQRGHIWNLENIPVSSHKAVPAQQPCRPVVYAKRMFDHWHTLPSRGSR
jgi:hypothetical protein